MSLFKSVAATDDSIHNIVAGLVAKSKDGKITIAPGIARRMLAECNFDGQRKLRVNRINRHVRRMKSGLWNEDISVIHLARTPDGKLHNVNGQHRTAAIVESGAATRTRVVIVDVASPQSVRRLYASFDEPGASRTDSEMLDGVGASDSLGLSRKVMQALFRSIALIRNNLEPMGPRDDTAEARERDSRLLSLPEWADVARTYEGIIKLADGDIGRTMLTQGTMGPALYLLRHQPKLAYEFWEGLARNDGLRRTDPRARLIADFRNRNANSGGIRQGVQRVSFAWNAFYEKRDLSIIRCVEGAAITFKGTPKGAKR